MFNFEYVQIIKIRTSVSLQITTSESNSEPCYNLISRSRNKILFFSWSNNKSGRFWQISGIVFQHILFDNCDHLIFLFTFVETLLPVVTLWHILFKTCYVKLSERSTLFLSCLILSTVYVIHVIYKLQEFHSYITICEYEPDQCRNPFFIDFLVLRPYRQ